MKKIIILLAFIISFSNAFSQSGFASCGSNASGTSGNISYSIGQIDYKNSANGFSINEGVQQPYEMQILGIENYEPTISMSVFPNPTQYNLILKINETKFKNLSFEIIDVKGIEIVKNEIKNDETSIDFASFQRAIYFLKITSNNKLIQTFKIIKN